MSDSSIFRSSVMGGFNRQDVLTYIESRARTHTEELGEIGRRLDASQKELSETKTALATARSDLAAAKSDADTYKTELDIASTELAILRSENSELKEHVSTGDRLSADLKAELDQLQKRLGELQTAMQEIEQDKIRVTNIELEAYGRAKKIEDAAISNAAMARMALSALFAEAKKRFDQTKDDAVRTIFYISQEMDRLKDEMNNIPEFFDIISGQIDALKFGSEKKAENSVSSAKEPEGNVPAATESVISDTEYKYAYNPADDMQFEGLVYPEENEEADEEENKQIGSEPEFYFDDVSAAGSQADDSLSASDSEDPAEASAQEGCPAESDTQDRINDGGEIAGI